MIDISGAIPTMRARGENLGGERINARSGGGVGLNLSLKPDGGERQLLRRLPSEQCPRCERTDTK
jgi:hypothetical protein